MRVVGLFSGIGGIELGLERAGHETVLLCESDPAASRVLHDHFPSVAIAPDVRELETLPAEIDLLAGGFPCQDLSQAGTGRGLEGTRSGLVFEVFRLLERNRVPWVLLENVPFMLRLGRGAAMRQITSRFTALGYDWAYRVVDARGFGLPQRRERVLILASTVGDPRTVLFADEAGALPRPRGSPACGFYWTEGFRGLGWARNAVPPLKGSGGLGIPSPPAVACRDGRILIPGVTDAERLQGFPVGWTKPADTGDGRSERWRLLGNAVPVPVARWVGRRLRSPGDIVARDAGPVDTQGMWPPAARSTAGGPVAVNASTYPVAVAAPDIDAFLKAPRALSLRASAGFRERLLKGGLERAKWFDAVVDRHITRMRRAQRT